jgi:hypothetical protein
MPYHQIIFYHKTFSSFPSFQNQIEHFLCHWKRKTKSYKCFWTSKTKEQNRKRRKRKWYFVLKCVFRHYLFLAITSCSFFTHFEWFQRLQMCYFIIYKNLFKVKRQKIVIKELKLQNHTKQWWKKPKDDPLHFERAYLAHFPLDWAFFIDLDVPSEGLQNCFNFQKWLTMDKKVIMIHC